MTVSPTKYKFFLWFWVGLFLANLLVLNDVLRPFIEAEQQTLVHATENYKKGTITAHVPSFVYTQFAEASLFSKRLVGIVFMLLCVGGIYVFGKKIIGTHRMQWSLLVLFSSFGVVPFSKFATQEVWTWGIQVLLFCSLILYLKKPSRAHRITHFALLLGTAFVAPYAGVGFGVLLWVLLALFYKKAQILHHIQQWLIWIPTIVLAYFVGQGQATEGLFWSHPRFYGYALAGGGLLFIAFWLPGLWYAVRRFFKKEEFSILMLAGIIASVATLSLSVHFFFSLLIAKQLDDYFVPNYPYERWVKTIGIVMTIVVFCGAMYGMLDGFQQFGAIGFRAAMLLSLAYWIPMFVFLIGLYGKNHSVVAVSLISAGGVLTFIFWMYFAPLFFQSWY